MTTSTVFLRATLLVALTPLLLLLSCTSPARRRRRRLPHRRGALTEGGLPVYLVASALSHPSSAAGASRRYSRAAAATTTTNHRPPPSPFAAAGDDDDDFATTTTAGQTRNSSRGGGRNHNNNNDAGRVAVVGGGASGMFAAACAAERLLRRDQAAQHQAVDARQFAQVEVVVYEATPSLLTKVSLSGGGRCNVLHDTTDPVPALLQGYPRGAKELHGILSKRFTPTMMRGWFEGRGVSLKTEDDGRMFPVSDDSATIVNCIRNAAAGNGVSIKMRERVAAIRRIQPPQDDGDGDERNDDDDMSGGSGDDDEGTRRENAKGSFALTLQTTGGGKASSSSPSSTQEEYYDAVILATGSSPTGYQLASTLGLTVVQPVPSLFTLSAKHQVASGGILHGLAGLSVPNARCTLRYDPPPPSPADDSDDDDAAPPQPKKKKKRKKKKLILQQTGPLLITHKGISGPAALRLSSYAAREFAQLHYQTPVEVHWCPECGTTDDITDALWSMTTSNPKRTVSSSCPLVRLPSSEGGASVREGGGVVSAVPRRLWSNLVTASGFSPDDTWGSGASKKKVRTLARSLSEFTLDVTGRGTFKEEFVTAGGVSLKELDMRSMECKDVPGLFCVGESIDVDGVTGGYNFMNCWGTGFLAGNGAVERAMEAAAARRRREDDTDGGRLSNEF